MSANVFTDTGEQSLHLSEKPLAAKPMGKSDTTENDIHRFGKRMYVKDTYKNVNCLTLEYANYGQRFVLLRSTFLGGEMPFLHRAKIILLIRSY